MTVYETYSMRTGHDRFPGFRVVELNENYSATKGMHYHDFWEILYIEEGAGWHHVDFSTYPITGGQLLFIRRGQLHQLDSESSLRGISIMFDENVYREIFPEGQHLKIFSSEFSTGVEISADIAEQIRLLKQSVDQCSRYRKEITLAQLKIVLLICEESSPCGTAISSRSSLVDSFFQLLDRSSLLSRFNKDYARELFVTPHYLNEKLIAYTGKNTQHWVKERVILEAKRYLSRTVYSISEIAQILDFPDSSSFCRFFKKRVELSPKQWRHGVFGSH